MKYRIKAMEEPIINGMGDVVRYGLSSSYNPARLREELGKLVKPILHSTEKRLAIFHESLNLPGEL